VHIRLAEELEDKRITITILRLYSQDNHTETVLSAAISNENELKAKN
jgi:hypothetical protein